MNLPVFNQLEDFSLAHLKKGGGGFRRQHFGCCVALNAKADNDPAAFE